MLSAFCIFTFLSQDVDAGTKALPAALGDKFVDVNHLVPITCLAVKSEIKVSYCTSVKPLKREAIF